MYEVEVKVPADHASVAPRLEKLGGAERDVVCQTDTYYDAPHRDFATTDEALRVRREQLEGGEARTLLTYKGPLVEAASKTRREAETRVADGETLRSVLEGVGFQPAATVSKRRRRFDCRGCTVTLDTVEGLGEYVEVEREAQEVEEARTSVIELVEALGLDPDEQIRTSYLELLENE